MRICDTLSTIYRSEIITLMETLEFSVFVGLINFICLRNDGTKMNDTCKLVFRISDNYAFDSPVLPGDLK